MKLTRKAKAWLAQHKPAKPKRRRHPKEFHFDLDSGNVVWRVHGSYGKPIADL